MLMNGSSSDTAYGYSDDRTRERNGRLYKTGGHPSHSELEILSDRTAKASTYPHCSNAPKNIPVYDLATFSPTDEPTVLALQEEWHSILHTGPGVYVLKHFYTTASLSKIDQTNSVFDSIVAAEASSARGDHFATSNANSRIWNSLQKHAIADPTSFIQYYSNPWLRHVSESWLGPDYTVTAQVNIVRPGGAPQMPHRDYHLGFQTADQCARWPKTMHAASQFLTLQGAVAHSDMPLESGPTRFLPFSQVLEDGYMAWRTDAVKELFADKWVSLPLEKGDAVFFNPALIHAAGENRTSPGPGGIDRSANLLQISSAFGKTMEKIDHEKIVIACWDELRAQVAGGLDAMETECIIRTMTEGYPFPTNLDRRPPAPGGMAPESQTDIVRRSLKEQRTKEEIVQILRNFSNESSG